MNGAPGRPRTADIPLTRRVLCQSELQGQEKKEWTREPDSNRRNNCFADSGLRPLGHRAASTTLRKFRRVVGETGLVVDPGNDPGASRLSGVRSATELIDENTGTRPGGRTPKLRLLRPSPLPDSARRAKKWCPWQDSNLQHRDSRSRASTGLRHTDRKTEAAGVPGATRTRNGRGLGSPCLPIAPRGRSLVHRPRFERGASRV